MQSTALMVFISGEGRPAWHILLGHMKVEVNKHDSISLQVTTTFQVLVGLDPFIHDNVSTTEACAASALTL